MTVRFGTQTVLRNLSLEVRRGETLVVIGESGCGKTVLLKDADRLAEADAWSGPRSRAQSLGST